MNRIRRRIATVLVVGMLGATLPASVALAGPGHQSQACHQLLSLGGTIGHGDYGLWKSIVIRVCF